MAGAAVRSVVIFLILLITAYTFPQSPDAVSLFTKGKELYGSEKYFQAITELKRFLFFSKDSAAGHQANLMIATAYRRGGFYRLASPFFLNARDLARSSEEKTTALIEHAKNEILKGTPETALKILQITSAQTDDQARSSEITYWKGIAELFSGNLSEAAVHLEILSPGDTLAVLCRLGEEELVNPRAYKLISAFLPGIPQIYLGEYSSGFLSLFWCGLWGYTTANAFAADRIFDGIMTGNFLFFRFYNGNLENAELFGQNHNTRIKNSILSFYQNNYNGLKPEW